MYRRRLLDIKSTGVIGDPTLASTDWGGKLWNCTADSNCTLCLDTLQ
jgi:creatinine amidohydrolase/Fe(II)-dependent formamide hydrolase-like protein